MATNGRPVTRINVNYGGLGTAAEARALSPVFIAPRYILHSYKDGYADGELGIYDAGNNTLKNIAWPSVRTTGTKIDVGSAQLFIERPYVFLNAEGISGTGTVSGNKIALTEGVRGSDKSTKLGKFDVNVGDLVFLEGGTTDGASVTTTAKITGIKVSKNPATVTTTPTKLGDTKTDLSAAGTFTGKTDCDYLVKVVSVNTDTILCKISAITGDAGYVETLEISSTPREIGSFGATLAAVAETNYTATDSWLVSCSAETDGKQNIIFIDTVIGSDYAKPVCKFASDNYSDDFVEIKDGLVTSTADVTVADALNTTIGDFETQIAYGKVYVSYRELVTEGALSLVSSVTDGVLEWAGVSDPQNPLGLMAAVGANVEGASFFLVATEGDTVSDYIKAVNYVAQFEAVYALVPYSNDAAVRSAVISAISKYAAPEIAQYKRGWVASTVDRKSIVYKEDENGHGLLADIKADGAVEILAGNVINAGVVPGDYVVVYGNYNPDTGEQDKREFEIESVESDVIVKVVGAPTGVSKIEFVRILSNVDYARAIAAEASGINAIRINLVWGDGVTAQGYNNLPLSVACAALAAQRSALAPHAPMTDLPVPGIITQDTLKFTDTEYEIMNAGGVWIIHNNSDGETVTYHQITTRTDGTIAEEDSCVSNGDTVIRILRNAIKSLVGGSTNVYDELLVRIESQLIAEAEAIKVAPYPVSCGPLLIDFSVDQVYRSESNKGVIIASCTAEMGRPYAGGDFTFNLM